MEKSQQHYQKTCIQKKKKKKNLKTKIKSHQGNINTKEGSQCIYVLVILILKNTQVLLEKYEYVVQQIFSDDENSNDSYEKYSDEKIQMKKTKYINLFLEKYQKFLFFRFRKFLPEIQGKNVLENISELFKLGSKKFNFSKYNSFFSE